MKTETAVVAIDRICTRYLMSEINAAEAMDEIIKAVGTWTDPTPAVENCTLCHRPMSAAETRLKVTTHFPCIVNEAYGHD